MELTNDQKETLKEIPGYVRKDMIERWIRYYSKWVSPPNTQWDHGFNDALKTLKTDMDLGILNNDKDMREC